MRFNRKDLLGIRELSVEEINTILDTAESFKEVSARAIKKVPALRGKTVINLFFEASTRTRTSFEIAAKRLSADAVNISASTSSVTKGESLIDTAQNLQAMAPDAIVIRHPSPGVPHQLSRLVSASIINGGDGAHEHPTQALLDAFTIREHKHKIGGLQVAIVGDIMHSRVARSNAHLLTKLGAHVRIAGPRTLIPVGYDKLIDNAEGSLTVCERIEEAISGSDVVMMLRIQRERMTAAFFPSLKEYSIQYGLTLRRLELAASDCIVMHPGPVNRGIEISSEVVDSARSLILDQVTNGVAVRMAILFLLIGTDAS
ncbi:MAG TPA: aspartate carbamoyltransferase catalytic subunit [Blastocatellia bacterium]|jgi:aspartate carbamoyltransferase catalytic subunit|nr:aspartate carbamoyltransferase catalytic subunit [Blastocatellia bacterium]